MAASSACHEGGLAPIPGAAPGADLEPAAQRCSVPICVHWLVLKCAGSPGGTSFSWTRTPRAPKGTRSGSTSPSGLGNLRNAATEPTCTPISGSQTKRNGMLPALSGEWEEVKAVCEGMRVPEVQRLSTRTKPKLSVKARGKGFRPLSAHPCKRDLLIYCLLAEAAKAQSTHHRPEEASRE